MMKQKRIVAVALGLALSVSPMIVLPTAFADQVSGNPSSSISARSTAPNPLDKFSTEEKAFLNNHKDKIASALGIDGFDPSTTDYYGVKESALDTVAGKIPTSNTGLLKPMGAPLEIDTNATGWLVDGKIAKDKPSSGDMAYDQGQERRHRRIHAAHRLTGCEQQSRSGRAEGRDRHRQWHRRHGLQSGEGRHIHRARRRGGEDRRRARRMEARP